MNKAELIEHIASKSDISKAAATRALAARGLGARVIVNSYRSSIEAESGWLLRADRVIE